MPSHDSGGPAPNCTCHSFRRALWVSFSWLACTQRSTLVVQQGGNSLMCIILCVLKSQWFFMRVRIPIREGNILEPPT